MPVRISVKLLRALTLLTPLVFVAVLGGCGSSNTESESTNAVGNSSVATEGVATEGVATESVATSDAEGATAVHEQPAQEQPAVTSNRTETDSATQVEPAGKQTADPENVDDLVDSLVGSFGSEDTSAQVRNIYAPSKSQVLVDWLQDRASRQQQTVDQFEVFHEFQFQDLCTDSGIDFVNRVVEDAGKKYTAAHYDHGNGVAISDIDNDGLYDIYFTNQVGANGLYRNQGGGKFENITQQAGVRLADRISVTASFADFDNDGDADLFVSTVRHGNALFQNNGKGVFQDVTEANGLTYEGHSSSIVFFDFDRDGWLDIFLTNVGRYTTDEVGTDNYFRSREAAFSGHLDSRLNETSLLYRNKEGKGFENVTEKMGLVDSSWSGDASPVDANGDGWPDLYVLNMQGHDQYFENVQGKRFEKKSRDLFPKTSWGAMGIKVFDADNDGRFDIMISDMHSDMSEIVDVQNEKSKANMKWPEDMLQSGGQSVWGNSFFHKQADGSYKEASDAFNVENFWPWGLSVGDINADGYDDLFITSSMNLPFRYAVNSLLLNNRGKKFLDSEFLLGVEPRRDGRTAQPWFELDCNGSDVNHSYAQQYGITSGKVVVWGSLGTRSSVIFDCDNDGDLDIITNDFHSEPMVLISDLAEKKKIAYLKLKLVGSKSNRDGLGAVVSVKTSEGSYKKVHDGQSGYLSQSSQLLYFGLDEAQNVDSIRIDWPSGTKQELTNVGAINRVLTIEEK